MTSQPIDQVSRRFAAIFDAEDLVELRPLKHDDSPEAGRRWLAAGDVGRAVEWLAKTSDDRHSHYFGANPRRRNGGKTEDVRLARCLFCDFDGGAEVDEVMAAVEKAGRPWPTAIVRSGGGVHLWWRLAEPMTDLAAWSRCQKQLALDLGSDPAVSDAPRIMRLPGYRNWKYDPPPLAELVELQGHVCRLEQLMPGGIPPEPVRPVVGEVIAGSLSQASHKFLADGWMFAAGCRRATAFAVACDMQARGWTQAAAQEAIMPVMQKAGLNRNELRDMPRQIANAFSCKRDPLADPEPPPTASSAAPTSGESADFAADLARAETRTDVGLARRLARSIRGKLTYVRERKKWLHWDGRRHADQAEHIVELEAERMHDELWAELARLSHAERTGEVVKFVRESGTRAHIAASIAGAKSQPGINTSQTEYDAHPWLLNVRNGVVDLKSGEIMPHDPALRITQLAAVDFIPGARSELWERFIRDVTRGDDELAEFLQCAFGLALCGDVSDEVLVCHNGGGCNGKSTALEAVGKMLGDYSAVAPPGLFTARKFDSHPTELAGLRGKRFVTAIEQEGNRALRESLIKQMTGGDTIRTRGMREDFWEMQPTWHIHIAYNTEPALTSADDGIRRRLVVVPWNATFKGSPDLTVKERLTGESERPGILNWCLDGLRKRLMNGRLVVPEVCRIKTDQYIDDEDVIGRFIAERAELEAGEMVELRELLRALRSWMQADGCPRHLVDGYTTNTVARELARRGFQKIRPDAGINRKKTMIVGLRLVATHDDAFPYEEDPFLRPV
jgi:P4 family phage/plasmid primase-like protien